jgi:hypothetical protein
MSARRYHAFPAARHLRCVFPAWAMYVRRSPGFLISPLRSGDLFSCNLHICMVLSHPLDICAIMHRLPSSVISAGGAEIDFRANECGPLSLLPNICAALSKLLVLRAVVLNLSEP